MPLTPEDVRNKRFTPVRLREGYDMGEVDQFLDEVEAELERLTLENEDLRSKLAAASSGPSTSSFDTFQPPAPAPMPVAPPPAPTPAPVPAPTSVGDASSAAARLLEIATNNADELVENAKNEADRILGEARTKADRVENEARGKAERMESEARMRAQKLDQETAERRQQAFGNIEKERDDLNREIEHLRTFEREYRSRLKSYFQAQLSHLEGEQSVAAALPTQQSAPAPAAVHSAPPEHAPRRLKSLFGDDDGR
ncbi:DivIVA domain-containing protein [Mumia flava]|uniref:Cell wall synthesis protein Wag31 n=1 Tax=Mumia flava TaxID=1348852 RepID=A0A0B2BV62_9ACTN|nr:DivIVA domain-containing protein [Mumia flava]PJJ56016.1 DivIVA domain-containing protein [Mumia flava]